MYSMTPPGSGRIQGPRLRPKTLQLAPVGVTVTVVHEAAIARVDAQHTARVLDRAPVLLGTGRNLPNVREYTVRIGAVRAIELFNGVEVGELLAVECQVVAPVHARDPIPREAHRLVHSDEQVEQQHRNDKCFRSRCFAIMTCSKRTMPS